MAPGHTRLRLPKSSRIVSSDDFGVVLRSAGPGSTRIGRDSVSLCALAHRRTGLVRFGFTVGKHHVPRAVDRNLVKRIMRECAREALPAIRDKCSELGIGIEISLRCRASVRISPERMTVGDVKADIRRNTQSCIKTLSKRLEALSGQLRESS